ncbi:MAG: ABC transporter permease, partial [Phenylobacterium sp.]
MIPLSLRFAARELRSGVKGFRIFLACLALGVAAIAAASSTAQAFRNGLASQAREILGGDIAVSIQQRAFTDAEKAVFARQGRTSYAVASRGMAEAASGERHLAEIRGVSGTYPLAGKVVLSGQPSVTAAIADRGDAHGAAVEQGLLDRLHLKVGDRFLLGNLPMVVTAVLHEEPDRLSRGFALGPRVLTSLGAVEQGGFTEPGLPFGSTARIAISSDVDPEAAIKDIQHRLPGQRFRFRDRSDAAPGLHRLIDQLEYFLAFIGLASLVAGGMGVHGAVSAYLEQRKPAIATLKALGAEGGLVRNLYLAQIAVLSAIGVGIGLILGAAAPLAIGAWVKDSLPIPALFAVYPAPLIKAAAFGLLAAAAFSLAPLARARATPPASLFRAELSGGLPWGPELAGAALAGAALAGLAVVTAPTPLAASLMIGGVAVAFALLWALGRGAAGLAGRLRSGASGPLRIGLAGLAGPHSAARTASPAIGLGVALLTCVVLIQSSLLKQLAEVAPQSAPAVVFTDIPADRVREFDAVVERAFGEALTPRSFLRAPFVTGRIVAVRGQPVDRSSLSPQDRWAYDADISMSAIGPKPPGANIRQGRWWPGDYQGPPLAALDVDVARGAHLRLGDRVGLLILGRRIDAQVAVLRKVDFGGFGANFPLVLTPGALEGAVLRQVAIAKANPAQEAAVVRALGGNL